MEDATTDGVLQLKDAGFRSDLSAYIYSRLLMFTVAMWQCPGVGTVITACCLNDEGGFGSHLECCRALC